MVSGLAAAAIAVSDVCQCGSTSCKLAGGMYDAAVYYHIIALEKGTRKNLLSLFPEVTKTDLAVDNETAQVHTSFGEYKFRLDLQPIFVSGTEEEDIEALVSRQKLLAVYLFDETEILRYRQEITDERMVAGLIYLDNYDEALESVEEVRRSLLTALIDRKINKAIGSIEGVVKKLEKDKYFFTIKQKYMEQLEEERFSILEEVKAVNIGNEMAVTLSIGIGMGGDSYSQNYVFARAAIDMALGRGGDQADSVLWRKISAAGKGNPR